MAVIMMALVAIVLTVALLVIVVRDGRSGRSGFRSASCGPSLGQVVGKIGFKGRFRQPPSTWCCQPSAK